MTYESPKAENDPTSATTIVMPRDPSTREGLKADFTHVIEKYEGKNKSTNKLQDKIEGYFGDYILKSLFSNADSWSFDLETLEAQIPQLVEELHKKAHDGNGLLKLDTTIKDEKSKNVDFTEEGVRQILHKVFAEIKDIVEAKND
jgi:hypothetical protein